LVRRWQESLIQTVSSFRIVNRHEAGAASIMVTAPLPPQILPRALSTPSLLAHIRSDKFCDGLLFHRQECMA